MLILHVWGLLWFMGNKYNPLPLAALFSIALSLMIVSFFPRKLMVSIPARHIAFLIVAIGMLGCLYLMAKDLIPISAPHYVSFVIRCFVFFLLASFLWSLKKENLKKPKT